MDDLHQHVALQLLVHRLEGGSFHRGTAPGTEAVAAGQQPLAGGGTSFGQIHHGGPDATATSPVVTVHPA